MSREGETTVEDVLSGDENDYGYEQDKELIMHFLWYNILEIERRKRAKKQHTC